jgi:FKBP-type peptidyl-prolyl cis-trans isomerase SlyD
MEISDKTAVSLHYTLTNAGGEELDSSVGDAPLVYLHGTGNIIPGLEEALTGKKVGDKLQVSIQPEKGYGLIDPAMSQVVSRKMFEGMDIEVGMQFHADVNFGSGVITIAEINGDDITIDGNHPLAGEVLNFDVEILEVRAATADELAHGHVHGHGCDHH